jgi:cell division cycle 14
LYYCALKAPPPSDKILLRNRHNQKVPVNCFCIDDELVYWNFFLDFGPLNLGQLYRFTIQLHQLLQDTENTILFYSSTNPAKRANAIYLICAWQVLELHRSPEQAFHGFSFGKDPETIPISSSGSNQKSNQQSRPPPFPLTTVGQLTTGPLPMFHDASPVACTYELTLMHCLQGLQRAKQLDFFDWDTFDVEEYEHYEQVEVRTNKRTKKVSTFLPCLLYSSRYGSLPGRR